ncbi:leucine rich repeat kinase 2 [Anaeramoeba flamelloides]|uniref:Leucine rich repeat kinase 2 n=1 Tax=Anaeramoeba flamelloides TaxID=1746091 RepID=A0ABQ8Z638_9EUKA|nr:leucine rich repeat kinase 2 [Anaeramoeba flamelloides]
MSLLFDSISKQCYLDFKKELKQNKADPNARLNETGTTPLMYLIDKNSNKKFFSLLLKTCDPNLVNNKQTALHLAIRKRVPEEILYLFLEKELDLTLRDNYQNTVLHGAIRYSCTEEFIEKLIKKGAPINALNIDGESPLFSIFRYRLNFKLFDLFLEHNATITTKTAVNNTLLHYAIKYKKREMKVEIFMKFMEQIVQKGVNTKSKNIYGDTALHYACLYDSDKQVINWLIKRRAHVTSQNALKQTPLYYFCMKNEETVNLVEVQKKMVVLIQKKKSILNNQDIFGNTPLHTACMCGCSVDIIILLLNKGAKVNVMNNIKQTPLHLVCQNNEYEERKRDTIIALVGKGASVNAQDLETLAPLHLACLNGLGTEVVDILINRGANPRLKSKYGDPYRISRKSKNAKASKILYKTRSVGIKRYKENSELREAERELFEKKNTQTRQVRLNIVKQTTHQIDLLDAPEIDTDEIKNLQEIGEGKSKIVYRGKYNNGVVALLKLKGQFNFDKKEIETFKSEIQILNNFRHPNMVQIFGASTKVPNYAIICEFCEGGDLTHLLQSTEKITDEKKFKLAEDIAKGLSFLHDKNIIHRDLKSANVLITKDVAKITDLGISIIQSKKGETLTEYAGTKIWMAPEILRGEQYSFSADIYSMGIILWEIATRKLPLTELKESEIMEKVGNQNYRPKLPEKWTYFNELMASCWDTDPNVRPQAVEFLEEIQTIKQKYDEEN